MNSMMREFCLSVIGLLLLGYVVGDKGFAHIGVPPIYIGEVVIAICIFIFLYTLDFRIFLESRIVWYVAGFDLWCFFQTIPYISDYGIDTLRDSVVFGYSIFAFIISSYMLRTWTIIKFLALYDSAISICVILMPLLILRQRQMVDVGDADMPIIYLKAGDVAVHLAGILTYRLLGLREIAAPQNSRFKWNLDWLFWLSWFATMLWAVSASRGGMLALASAFLVPVLFGFVRHRWRNLMLAMIGLMALLLVLMPRIERDDREISLAQITNNISSIFMGGAAASGDGLADLESTAEWRLQWWGDIVDDVVFGPYFWTGKGFGLNLADADGYQVDPEERLRSPHSIHMTVLERAGVPGLALWLLVQGAFAVTLIRRAGRMRKKGEFGWQRLNLWILSYWLASIVNASFDVYLEGPQGGIWYWSIFGFGLAVLAMEKRILSGRPFSVGTMP